jgi:hypothetical protein
LPHVPDSFSIQGPAACFKTGSSTVLEHAAPQADEQIDDNLADPTSNAASGMISMMEDALLITL